VNRPKIPADVRRLLRREVGFGCPVPDCGRPYLEWHHFDPPWKDEQHNRPEGMIALCVEHHKQADNGAFTKEQLHAFKKNGMESWAAVSGKFNWMRNDILAVVGGNFYYKTPVIFQLNDDPIIWFNRDENNYLLLNITMLTTSGEDRAAVRDNEWSNTGGEVDIQCPPSARSLDIKYKNGDRVCIEFFEIASIEELKKRYSDTQPESWGVNFPVTAVEVTNVVAGSGINFSAKRTSIGGGVLRGNFASNCGAGIALNTD